MCYNVLDSLLWLGKLRDKLPFWNWFLGKWERGILEILPMATD